MNFKYLIHLDLRKLGLIDIDKGEGDLFVKWILLVGDLGDPGDAGDISKGRNEKDERQRA